MKKMRKNWPLGFLSLMAIRGVIGIINGDWLEAVWITWLGWIVYFIPVKKKNET